MRMQYNSFPEFVFSEYYQEEIMFFVRPHRAIIIVITVKH